MLSRMFMESSRLAAERNTKSYIFIIFINFIMFKEIA